MKSFSYDYLESIKKILDDFPHSHFDRLIGILLKAYEEGRTIFIMGNGGSAATASHWTCDLGKGCCRNLQKKIKVICLNDNIPTMLAYANDLSYEDIFLEQLKTFFVSGDVVIGISGSGNSANVIKAIRYAKQNGGITIGLCGFNGGELGKSVHLSIKVKADDMQQIEDVHLIVGHMVMQKLTMELETRSRRHDVIYASELFLA